MNKYVKIYLSLDKNDKELGFGFYTYGLVEKVDYVQMDNTFVKENLTIKAINYVPSSVDYYRYWFECKINGKITERKYTILKP